MGVLIRRSEDSELYNEAYEEAQRIIRISDEVRISVETVEKESEPTTEADEQSADKLTTSKLAQKIGIKTADLIDQLTKSGNLEARDGKNYITKKGKDSGGEFRMSPKHGPYFLWPESFRP